MDWTKFGALGTLGCLAVAILSVVIQLSMPGVNPWIHVSVLVVAILGAGGFFVTVLWKRFDRLRSRPFRMLYEEVDYLHRTYRRLDQDEREKVRLPLNSASWPLYGDPWDFIHIQLYVNRSKLTSVVDIGRALWTECGWPIGSIELLSVNPSTVMVDLLASLDAFRAILRTKFT